VWVKNPQMVRDPVPMFAVQIKASNPGPVPVPNISKTCFVPCSMSFGVRAERSGDGALNSLIAYCVQSGVALRLLPHSENLPSRSYSFAPNNSRSPAFKPCRDDHANSYDAHQNHAVGGCRPQIKIAQLRSDGNGDWPV